jgi:hypothetical protein
MANGDKKSGSYFQPFREITIPFETRSKTSSSEIITSVIGQINNEFRKIYNRLFSRRVDADLIKASNGLKPMKFEGAAEYLFDAPMDIENPLTIKASNNYPSVNLAGADGKTLGVLRADSNNRVYFLAYSKNSNYYERFYLPTPDSGLGENVTNYILTSKDPVTVEQGGTNANSPFGATEALMALFLGNLTSTTHDLKENDNLDNIKEGVFRSGTGAITNTLVGKPPMSTGFRLIASYLTTGSSFVQIAIGFTNSVNICVRVKTSEWGDWKKLTFS